MSVKLNNQSQWLNYHHLFYFSVIAREGSIAKAAEKLNMGQPTLSTQLKVLEENIGKALFERKKQRLHLTEAGQIALIYANQVFELGSEMMEVLQDQMQNHKIHVSIGALDSVPKTILLQLVSAAYTYGNCSISVLEGSSKELSKELSAHQIDLLISNYPPNEDFPTIHSRSLSKQGVVICGAPKFKHLKKNFPHSLQDQPFILPTKHSRLRADLEHYFTDNGIRVDQVAETQDTSLQRLLGQEGIGLIPLIQDSAGDLENDKKLIVLGLLEEVEEEFWIMAASRKIDNKIAASLFKDFNIKF